MMRQLKTLNNSKKTQLLSLLFWQSITISLLFVAICIVSAPSYAQTDPKEGQQMVQYDVYAGGIHALQSNLNIDVNGNDRYNLDLTAQTFGLLGKLAPWQGKFESHGWQSKEFKPELHQSTTIWRGEKEVKKYSYVKDGSFQSYSVTDDKNEGLPKKVDDKLTQGTSDVLTATLNTMQAIAQTNKCEGATEVFDGKRRFKLIFKEKQQVELEATRWNVYSGPAVECSAEVQPMAGKWHEKPRGWMSIQEQGRERGTMPTVWFANMTKGEPAIPVKVRVKTSYGTLFMHMTKYETVGKSLALKD